MVKWNFEKKSKVLKILDLAAFLVILTITTVFFKDKNFSGKIDRIFLPEEKNPGYYEILNNYDKSYISDELYQNGTENLMVNALWSGARDAGYSIEVHPDGSFIVSGSYEGEGDVCEYPMGTDRRLTLPAGDYVLSDGGASSEDGISLRIVGVQHMRGGETNYVTLACLPEQSTFHWDGDNNTELIVDMVVRPGFKADNLEFYPMLLRVENADSEKVSPKFYPCLTLSYDWENEDAIAHSLYYLYSIPKGALDGETVTESDWKVFANAIRYQKQVDRVVIDLLDGTGIEIEKKNYPMGKYGVLDSSKNVREGNEIKVTDYREVMDSFKTNESLTRCAEANSSLNAAEGITGEGQIKSIDENGQNQGLDETNRTVLADVNNEMNSTNSVNRKRNMNKLYKIRDFYDYLKALDGKDYTVFIAINDEGVNALNHGSMELLQKLGVKSQLIERDKGDIAVKQYDRNSYYAILKQGKALEEKVSTEKLSATGKLMNGVRYSVESAGAVTGEVKASVKIYGKEYAMNLRGMNFVVYDEGKHEVVDSVSFDTWSGLWCHRQP